MSRLRKGLKYNGGDIAESFRSMTKGGESPFGSKWSERIQQLREKAKASVEAAKLKAAGDEGDPPAEASANSTKSTDIIPPDTDYSRGEVGDFFQRVKLAEERDALEALKGDMDEEANKEEEEEPDKEYKDADGNVVYTDDYSNTMSGKDRRKESRANKKDIRKNLKGKEKRAAKKANRQQKRAARKGARCIKLENKGKTHKRFYRKNCM